VGYRTFLHEEHVPEGADVEDGEAYVSAVLQEEIYGRTREREGASRGLYKRFLRAITGPVLRPALAVAAVLIAAIIVRGVLTGDTDGDAPISMRGSEDRSEASLMASSELRPEGTLAFSWSVVEEADRHEVRIYGPDLSELTRFDVGSEGSFHLTRDELASEVRDEDSLYWRIVALRGQAVIVQSELAPLQITP